MGVLLAIAFVVMTAATAVARSFVTDTPAVQITGHFVVVNEEAFSQNVMTFKIEGQSYRIDHFDRESSFESEVLRFTLPGALTSSTVTRLGGLRAMTLVTPDASYHLHSSANDSSAFVLDSSVHTTRVRAADFDHDNMTPLAVVLQTGHLQMHDAQTVAATPNSRRRSVNPSPAVEHRNIAIYTARFAAHYGGSLEGVRLVIQHLFDVRDTALRDSGVFGIRDVLVYAEERNDPTWLATTETSDILGMLVFDPYVKNLRVQHQANAGYWDENPSKKRSSVAVVFAGKLASMACGTYVIQWHQDGLDRTVSHELGHVGGAEHNKANANSGACPYCFGWYNSYVRDIMAVACGDVDCHDLPIYSTPDVIYKADFWDYHEDVIAGSADENVARRLSETRYDVRDFWKTIPSP